MSINCAFCGQAITQANESKEHVIPNAIGGRKRISGFLCRICNSATGQEWDDELARQLSPICNLLDINRDRGGPTAVVFETVSGKLFRHRSDGHMTPHKYEVSERQEDGRLLVRVSAPSVRELKRHIAGLIRQYPQLKDLDVLEHARRQREYLSEPLKIDLIFGGLKAGRSIVKSCVALCHLAGVTLQDLEHAKDFLLGDGRPCFGYYNERDLLLHRPSGTFFHCVSVQGNPSKGQVLGYVEFFGYQRMVVSLSDSYEGPAFSQCYAVDPVAGRDLRVDVEPLDFTQLEIQAIYEQEMVSWDRLRDALEEVIAFYMEKSRERELSRIVDDAVQYALNNCGAKEGERVSQGHRDRFVSLLWERLEPFLLHQLEESNLTGPDE